MIDDAGERIASSQDDLILRAERIGRLAADEHVDHDEAHRIAVATQKLAERDLRKVSEEASGIALRAITSTPVLIALGGAFLFGAITLRAVDAPEPGPAILSAVLMAVVCLIILRTPFGRRLADIAIAQLTAFTGTAELAVLEAYTDQRRVYGQPGCDCYDWDEDDEG